VIYFAQSTEGGTIKIGCSVNVPARIKQLEMHYGQSLAVLATMPGGRDEERAIHERFVTARLGRSEQFRPVAEIMTFIGRPILVDIDPDTVEAMGPVPADRETCIRVRTTPEFKAWLEEAAEMCRIDVSTFLDFAAVHYATHKGFKKPAPKR
jgi:hypothetical protein